MRIGFGAAASLVMLIGSSFAAAAADAPETYRPHIAPMHGGERRVVAEEPAWRRVVVEEPGWRRAVVEDGPERWERRVYVRQERRGYDAYQEPGPRGRWREEDGGW